MRKKLLIIIAVLELSSFLANAQTNYALSLNGTTDYVTIGSPVASNGSYTKEAWIYQSSPGGAQNIISSPGTPFWINGSNLSAGQAGNFYLVADPGVFPQNSWQYVAVTYDAPSTTMNLYRNGSLVASNSSVPAYTAENMFIGTNSGTSSFFQGYVDEVRIWSVALTQAQLKVHIYSGPANNAGGLAAYYNCNAGSGTVLTSSCTNTSGLDGTLGGSSAWVTSPIEYNTNAVNFNGTNAVITIPQNSSLDMTSAITLEAWVYATKNSGVQNVISKSSNTTNTGYLFPRTDDGWANTVFYLYVAGGWKTVSAPYPSLNTWHHLAATYDGAAMNVYIDGVLAATKPQTGTIATNTNALTLGTQTGYSEYFGGSADEVRIWNLARTQTQVQAGMGTELDPASQTGLVSYYTFNQGITGGNNTGLTTVIDQSGNNNGTLSNFTLTGSSNNFVLQNPSIILPLTIISFTAQKVAGSVLLQWSTASEENTKSFTIQRTTTGNVWDDLGAMATAVNSSTIRQYSYRDNSPAAGINYYRLQETDEDGRKTYSDVKAVQFNNGVPALTVYNNPVTDGTLHLELTSPCYLSLYDTEGRMVWQKQAGAGLQLINVSGFGKGVFFLKANDQSIRILVL